MTYVSIRPTRLSHEIISQTKEFVINLPTVNMVTAVDFCGVKSGRDVNKFEETGLTPIASSNISAPQILQCPVSVECKVIDIKKLGSHDMFMAEIVLFWKSVPKLKNGLYPINLNLQNIKKLYLLNHILKSLTAKQNLKNIFRRTDKLRLRIFIGLKNILSNLKKLKKTYLQIEKASLFL